MRLAWQIVEILEYDQVDPVQVLGLNLLSLDYALYAVEEGIVTGQVGVYRLTVSKRRASSHRTST